MRVVFAGLPFFMVAALLGGCAKYPEVPIATGEPCESLEPLLAALPTDKKLHGLPMVYRGCNLANATVSLAYSAPEGSPSYVYNIAVIDEQSKYLASFAAQGRDFITGEQVILSTASRTTANASCARSRCAMVSATSSRWTRKRWRTRATSWEL